MPPKDRFSKVAKDYAAFRPSYPHTLYEHILSYVHERERAWDCATGTGQAARDLSGYFTAVYATDISTEQLRHAFMAPNIAYSASPAERTDFPDNYFDLITVSQALHWFDIPAFCTEAKRVAKPGGVIAVWGYGLIRIDTDIDTHIDAFYHDVVGPYWDKERRHIENHYADIPFDFEMLSESPFEMRYQWKIEDLRGYLSTWSSVQHFIRERGYDPVNGFVDNIFAKWGSTKDIRFPVFTKIGRIEK